jgi:hypothetical protein
MKRNLKMKKNDIIGIFVLTAILLIISGINYIIIKTPAATLLSAGIGILFYSLSVYVRATHGDNDCDYVQTGEAAVGAFAVFACLRFVTANPYMVVLAVFLSLLLYNIYLKIVAEPETKDLLLNGALVLGILAIIFFYLAMNNKTVPTATMGKIFSGVITSSPERHGGIGAALVAGTAALFISLALYPKMRLFSQGMSFFTGSRAMGMTVAVCAALVRSLLATVTVCLLGCLGGIGLYARSLARNGHPDIMAALIVYGFFQIMLILMQYMDPWSVAASAVCFSYILYAFHSRKRACLYDRH